MALLKGNESDDLTLKYLLQNNKTDTSGIQSEIDCIKETVGDTPLTTTAQNLSDAVNELDAGTVKDVEVDGTSVVTDNVASIDLTGKSNVGHTHTTSDITNFPTTISMTLLWTNDSPTSNFAAQTVPLDLSGYDAVLVMSMFSGTNQFINSPTLILIGFTGRLNSISGSNNRVGIRDATVSSTGIEFDTAYYNSNTNAAYVLPYKIYGIKGII